MKTYRKRMGFSSMELPIALGVLALLLAVLFPVARYARGRARERVCVENLKALHLAFAQYAADHDGFLPPDNNDILYVQDKQPDTKAHKRHCPSSGALLTAALRPYVHANAVWFCPEDKLAHQNTLALTQSAIDHRYGSYQTGWLLGLVKFPARIDGFTVTDICGKPVEMKPSEQVLLMDDQVMKTGCGDWAYSHGNQFNGLYLDGHVTAGKVECAG